MITGNYFSYLPGEDFQSTFTSISFVSDLPSTDISFLTNLIDYFKKTLNPDVSKRFSSIKEYKNYVLKYFHTDEFAEFKTNLADYMKALYTDVIEIEKQKLSEELSKPPVLKDDREIDIDEFSGKIPIHLEEKKRSKLQIFFTIAILLTIVGIAGYFIFEQINETKKEQEETAQLLLKQNQTIQDFQQKLKTLDQKKQPDLTSTLPAVKPPEKEVNNVNDKKVTAATKGSLQTVTKPVLETEKPKETPVQNVTTTKPVEVVDKKESAAPKEEVKEVKVSAPLLGLNEITLLPQQISGKEPVFPAAIRKTYIGRRATVKADLLIDENGNVSQVDLLESGEIPGDVQVIIKDTLKQWKYKPAQKGDMKVKVKWPVKFKIVFNADM
jgi:outer membrane biosynthesis protein TonB